MMSALFYLQVTTLKNAVLARLRRLRQPKYFFAAVVGAAYFYFFLFRHVDTPQHRPLQGAPVSLETVDWPTVLEPLGALLFFSAVVVAWILPSSRAALAFTEAEVAFLFPAPVTRRTLVRFKLIKSQLGILFSSLLFTLISNRWTFLSGSPWIHAAGWWLIFSLFNLHRLGASFSRQRLLEFGVDARRRQVVVGVALAVFGFITWFVLRRTLPVPVEANLADGEALWAYARAVLTVPPLGWLLWPFQLAVRPFLATDGGAFLAALWPALLLLAGHVAWVMRSDVAFEEASVELSRKRAERLVAMRAGKWSGQTPVKKRREPFRLASTGAPSTAFWWKSLVSAGPLYYPRNWLAVGVVLALGVGWLGRDPLYRPVLKAVGVFAGVLCGYGLLFGPIFGRRGHAQMLERFDLFKSYPVRGWQVVLGELLCQVMLLSVFEWACLGLMALAIGLSRPGDGLTPLVIASGAAGAGLLVVPLAGLLFALNFAGTLYFPAWLGATTQPGAGMEVMGQRLIFFVVYLVVFVVALAPAVMFGAVPFLLLELFFDQLALAVVLSALTATTVLTGELAFVLWWLGRRFERFDVSEEMPR